MEGLEVSEVRFKDVLCGVETLRFDSEYYNKKYLFAENYIKDNPQKFVKFEELGLDVDGSAFYPALEPYYNLGDYPFIRVGDIKKYVDFDNCVKVPFEILHKYPTLKHCKKGDIVLTKGGTIGLAGLITQDCCVTRDLIFINSSVLSEEDYICLYLFLSTKYAYSQLIRSSSQSVQPHLTITLVKNISIYKYSSHLKSTISQIYKKSLKLSESSKAFYHQAEKLLLEIIGLNDFKPNKKGTNIKTFRKSFLTTGRLDAEYYQPKYEEIENKIKQYKNGFSCIGKQFKQNRITIDHSKKVYNYIEIGDINVGNGSYVSNIIDVSELPANARIESKCGDLLISKVRPNRGAVSIIDKSIHNLVVSGAFTALEEKGNYKKEVLFVLLRTFYYKEWLLKFNVGTSYPVIKDEDILNLPIPLIEKKIQQRIVYLINESFNFYRESEKLLEEAKEMVEREIENA